MGGHTLAFEVKRRSNVDSPLAHQRVLHHGFGRSLCMRGRVWGLRAIPSYSMDRVMIIFFGLLRSGEVSNCDSGVHDVGNVSEASIRCLPPVGSVCHPSEDGIAPRA